MASGPGGSSNADAITNSFKCDWKSKPTTMSLPNHGKAPRKPVYENVTIAVKHFQHPNKKRSSSRTNFWQRLKSYKKHSVEKDGDIIPELIKFQELAHNESVQKSEEIANEFVKTIQEKDLDKLTEMLKDHPSLDLYLYVDPLGISALEWSVKVASTPILGLLIEESPHKQERIDMIIHALKISIQYDDIDIVKYLLHKKKTESEQKYVQLSSFDNKPDDVTAQADSGISRFEDARFADSVSPIILAAQYDRHEIIRMLLKAGESEIHPVTVSCPNPSRCGMYSCKKSVAGIFTLEESHSLLQAYGALSSPSFILNSGVPDPLLEAFQISADMTKLCRDDPAFKDEYMDISQKCRMFVRDFLDLCRTSDELDVLVQRIPDDNSAHYCCNRINHSRIQMALSFHQTEFVVHPHIQKYLQKAWLEGLPEVVLRNWYGMKKLAFVVAFLCLYPVLCLLYTFQLCPVINQFMKTAALKFYGHFASYLSFLVLLFVSTFFPICLGNGDLKCLKSYIFWAITFWVIGTVIRHFKLFFKRPHEKLICNTNLELNSEWRFYDTVMLTLFVVTIAMIISYGSQEIDGNIRAVYALACLLAFLRICSFMKEISFLGPLYISLKAMTLDITKFCILVIIFMTANVVALLQLNKRDICPAERTSNNTTNTTSKRPLMDTGPQENLSVSDTIQNHFTSYFWALFGYGEVSVKHNRVLIGDHPLGSGEENATVFFDLTNHILLYGYYISVFVVLLNMLIAMMANSYSRIEANSDVEWKFARCRLRMAYFNDVGVLPPPFNIIPIPKMIRCFKRLIRKKSRPRVDKSEETYEFRELVGLLCKRYWSNRQGTELFQKDDESPEYAT